MQPASKPSRRYLYYLLRWVHGAICVLLITSFTTLQAQPPPAKKDLHLPELQPSQIRAIGILKQEISNTKDYKYSSLRIIVRTAIADTLWPLDPATARALLVDSFHLVKAAEFSDSFQKGQMEDAPLAQKHSEARSRLRRDILAVAQRHDPALVRELVASMEEDSAAAADNHKSPKMFGSTSLKSRNLARMALESVESDPATAYAYAVDSFDYGIPEEVQKLFPLMLKKDANLARSLFEKGVLAFQSDTSNNLFDGVLLASYLKALTTPETNTRIVVVFLETALTRAQKVRTEELATGEKDPGLNNTLNLTLSFLRPLFIQYSPELALKLDSLLADISNDLPEITRQADGKYKLPPGALSADDITVQAEKEKDPEYRDALYMEAAQLLTDKAKFDEAISVGMKIKDDSRRNLTLSRVYLARLSRDIKNGDLYLAERDVREIRVAPLRVEGTIQLAKAAFMKRDKLLLQGLLSTTTDFLEKDDPTAVNAFAYLSLASAYVELDTETGFGLMAKAIAEVNNHAAQIEPGTIEMRTRFGGQSRVVDLIEIDTKACVQSFAKLSPRDADRALLLANRFESEGFRGLAVVNIAEGLLKAGAAPKDQAPRKTSNDQ